MNKNVKDGLKNFGRDVGTQAANEVVPVLLDGFVGLMKRLFSKKARQAHRAAKALQNR